MSNFDSSAYARQGAAYFACNQANKATTALSTTATGLILLNPFGSGKSLLIEDARFAFSAVPTAAGAVMLSMGNTPSPTAPTSLTADTIWLANGGGVATTSVARVYTIATLAVVNVYVMPLAVAGSTTASIACAPIPEGGIVVVQGQYVMFSHVTTVATGIGSFLWSEVTPP